MQVPDQLIIIEFKDKFHCSIFQLQERGEKVGGPYGRKIFKKEFRIFRFQYKSWLSQLYVNPTPHPWQQYRYEIENPHKKTVEIE